MASRKRRVKRKNVLQKTWRSITTFILPSKKRKRR